jgi:hypothetical protein
MPITGRGRPYGYETSRLPQLLDNRLTDGGEIVSLTSRAIPVTGSGGPYGCETSRLPHFSVRMSALRTGRPLSFKEDAWYSFLLEAESTPGPYCSWKD